MSNSNTHIICDVICLLNVTFLTTANVQVSEAEKASLFGGSGSGGGGGAVSRGMEATERARLDESTAKLER